MTNIRRYTITVLVGTALVAAMAPRQAHAQLGARTAEDWIKLLDSANRVQGLKIAETVEALKLSPGLVVADIGAGTGLFTLPLARAVRPGGVALAVEVDEQLLAHIAETATEQGVSNVQTIYGEYDDPLLGGDVDLAFIHDVLHHIEQRETYLKNLARYLKPSGRVAVIDYLPGRGGHRDDAKMQLTKDQVTKMMAQAGLKPVEDISLFDDKFFVIYGRP